MFNHDMSIPSIVKVNEADWQASPSKTVRRKRFHLVGEPESGQVTSLVEYLPGASFHRHGHPEGEEILVLEGIFSDDAGDWPAGSWLLNPEGFAHAPYSREGCLLFVKLRQYRGAKHLMLAWPELTPEPSTFDPSEQALTEQLENVIFRVLLNQSGESISIISLGIQLGAIPSAETHTSEGVLRKKYEGGVEGFVLEGIANMNGEMLIRHDWFRLPPGATLNLTSRSCTLYLKENNVKRLRNASR